MIPKSWLPPSAGAGCPTWSAARALTRSASRSSGNRLSRPHPAVTILRILPGEVGKGLLNGKPVFLLTGRHLVNDPLFVFQGTESLTTEHITVGTAHIITVASGRCASLPPSP